MEYANFACVFGLIIGMSLWKRKEVRGRMVHGACGCMCVACSMGCVRDCRGVVFDDRWRKMAFSTSVVGVRFKGKQGRRFGARCCEWGVREGSGVCANVRMNVGGGRGGGGGIGGDGKKRRTVRIRRKFTSKAKGWEWKGKRRGFAWWEEVGVMRAIGGIWKRYRGFLRGGEGRWVIQGLVGLGLGFFEKVVWYLDRVVNPDLETELVIEYGIIPPSPSDKYFVDPLKEWDLSKVTYYTDSFGRAVYLQTDSPNLLITAADFRDLHDDLDLDEHEKLEKDDELAAS